MKKVIVSILASALFSSVAMYQVNAASKSDIQVLVDARQVQFDGAAAYETSGRVMVPFRGIGEAIKAKVSFLNKKVTLTGSKQIVLTLGSRTAIVDGKAVQLDTAAMATNGRTYVPLRFVSENLGQAVQWDAVGRMVWIGSKDVPTLEEAGLKPVSLEPYRKWFTKKTYLLQSPRKEITYTQALLFKVTDLPSAFVRDIYSMELYTDPDTTNTYLKLRAKTTSTAGSLYYLTKKNDIRIRSAVSQRTINNGDGTKYCFYTIWSAADKTLDGIIDAKPLSIKDIEYIGVYGSDKAYIPLMVNPWKGN